MKKMKPMSVMVRASPKLGGDVEVAYAFLKKFPRGIESDEDEEPAVEERMAQEDEACSPNEDQDQPMETESQGFYTVESILKHRYKQGWRFLTKWENWPVSDATWEPVKAFVEPGGPINATFREYCQRNGLERPLRQAIHRSIGERGEYPQTINHEDPD